MRLKTADDIMPGNDLLTNNDDGTWTLKVDLSSSSDLLDLVDAQHLLFTGSGYTVEEIYFIDIVSGNVSTEEIIWQNDGSLGSISWNSDYRFAPASNSTGEECYTVPQDVWDKMKTGKFYIQFTIDTPDWYQIRITTGWWGAQWPAGKEDDITPQFMTDMVVDNGDGTYSIELNLNGSDLVADIDAEHLLFTGSGYTPLKLYFK